MTVRPELVEGQRGAAPLRWVLAFALALLCSLAHAAGIPPEYQPVVIEPAGLPARAEFDLTAVQARARQEGKRLYVYLGADDCRYCRRYEAFLAANAKELAPQFAADYIVVDLRSRLALLASAVHLKAGDTSLPYAEFQRTIGDERARLLVYPNVWLLDARLKPLMQMPSGAGTFQTVPEQLEILRLQQ